MKSMKLASGFAISALAMAIAGTAVAQETTTEVSYTGSVEVQAWFDFNNDDRDLPNIGFAGEDTSDMDDPATPVDGDLQAILEATVSVTHGPFSGDLEIGGDIDEADVGVANLKIEEGPISFGQLDSVVETGALIDTVTDGDVEDDDMSYDDIRAAFRYTLADFGLKLQLEGEDDTNDFGIAAAFNQDFDVAEVWFDAQHYEMSTADGTEDRTFFGLGTVVTPTDMITLTAAFQDDTTRAEGGAYGVKLDVDVTDTIMVFGQFYDPTLDVDDSEMMKAGYSVGFAPFTLEGHYKASLEDVGDGVVFTKATYSEGVFTAWASHEIGLFDGSSQTIETKVEYSDSPWAAYAGSEFVIPDEGDTGVTITLGGNYTTASDIEYGAQYENANDAAGDTNFGRLYASYSF